MLKYLIALMFFAHPILYADVIELQSSEASLYSQNGEDGVLAKIFQLITPDSRYCVEFGAYDGITGSNTYLLRLQGWNCLLLDRSFEIDEYKLHKEFITAENINRIFEKYSVPLQFDLLSIDVDFNDIYLWNALDAKYSPAVVVIEHNATLGPNEDKVVKYHPFFCGDGTDYFGASIRAFVNLGRSKGYSLVYVEKSGCNLFFIRDDIIQEKKLVFQDMNDVEKLYRPPSYSVKKDEKNRPYLTSEDLINK